MCQKTPDVGSQNFLEVTEIASEKFHPMELANNVDG
jgi:hypothetical protein